MTPPTINAAARRVISAVHMRPPQGTTGSCSMGHSRARGYVITYRGTTWAKDAFLQHMPSSAQFLEDIKLWRVWG